MVMSDVKEEEVVSRVTKMAAELHFSEELNFRDEGPCQGNELVMENMDDNKEKLTVKIGQNLFILYIFYALALCDFNNTDENLNWRNVEQIVPT